ncbi:hypothetical protein ACET3Z_007618 [Daucus carota]
MSEAVGLELRLGLIPWSADKNRGECSDGNAKMMKKKRAFAEIINNVSKMSGEDGVVGWPPVCSYRKRVSVSSGLGKMYVKVGMDGARILRKIDLSVHKDYAHLSLALQKLFASFRLGDELKDGDGNEYVTIYQDRDGDWMLVGDVPWEMFTKSCKRLRIIKRADIKDTGLHFIMRNDASPKQRSQLNG